MRSGRGALERAARHGAHEVAPIFGAGVDVLERIDGAAAASAAAASNTPARACGRRARLQPPRSGAASARRRRCPTRVSVITPSSSLIGHAAPCASAKSPARRLNSQKPKRVSAGRIGNARLGQKLVVGARRGHDAGEEIARPRRCACRARSAQHDFRVKRRRDHAPFRGRIGVGEAAAEGAAGADRMMRDVAHHGGEELAERSLDHRLDRTRRGARRRRSTSLPSCAADRGRAPSTPLMSTRWLGRASRNAMIGTRLWPPASTRPSSGATSASIATASSTVLGA